MRYYRNKQGTVVHRPDCVKVTKNSLPWLWAEDKTDTRITVHMMEKGIAPCRLCYPPLFPTRARLRLVSGDE